VGKEGKNLQDGRGAKRSKTSMGLEKGGDRNRSLARGKSGICRQLFRKIPRGWGSHYFYQPTSGKAGTGPIHSINDVGGY